MVRSEAAIANAIEFVGNALNGAMNSNQGSEDAVVAMTAWREMKVALMAARPFLVEISMNRAEVWDAIKAIDAALDLANGERTAKDA